MAILNWRNVDAPDFRGAVDTRRTVAQLLQNAFGGLSDGLGTFDTRQQDITDRAVLANAAQMQDADALRAAIANGAVYNGLDPAAMSTKGISSLGSRVGDLLTQRNQEIFGDNNQYNLERKRVEDAGMDAARPAIAALNSAVASGDQRAIAAARANPALQSLPADQLSRLLSGSVNTESNVLGNTNTRIGIRNAEETRMALKTAEDAYFRDRASIATPGQAASVVEQTLSKLPLEARQAYLTRMQGEFGNLNTAAIGKLLGTGSLESIAGTAGTRQGSPYDTVVGFGQFGTPPKPASTMSISEVIDFGKNTLIPATRGNAQLGLSGNNGTSAMGAYQFTQQTLKDYAPKVLGKDWETQSFSPENQEKLAKAIFEDRKDGNLKSTWAALPDATPGAYKNMSWDQVRNEITRREVGQGVPNLTTGDVVSPTTVSTQASRQNLGIAQGEYQQGLVGDLTKARSDNRPLADIIAEKVKTSGAMSSMDPRQIAVGVEEVKSRANANGGRQISDAEALAIYERSLVPRGGIANWAAGTDALGGSLFGFGKYTVDSDRLQNNINNLTSGNLDRAILSSDVVGRFGVSLEQAQAQYDAARASLLQTQSVASARPGVAARIPEEQAKVNRAKEILDMVTAAQRGDPGLNPNQGDRINTSGNGSVASPTNDDPVRIEEMGKAMADVNQARNELAQLRSKIRSSSSLEVKNATQKEVQTKIKEIARLQDILDKFNR